MTLPTQYAWLANEPAPRMLLEALKLYGTLETPGSADNPVIIRWADEVGAKFPSAYNNWAAEFYGDDSIPWCGLAMAVSAVRAGRQPPNKYLSALAWAEGGPGWVKVPKPDVMLGDIMIFRRQGGGHVAMYVGEDKSHVHMLGGNQSDAFNIRRKPKADLYAVIRPAYNNRPPNVRKVMLSSAGVVSGSEA